MSTEKTWAQKMSLTYAALEGVKQGRADIVKGCLKMGAMPGTDIRIRHNITSGVQRPLVHWAVGHYNGDRDVLDEIISMPDVVDATDVGGDTALHLAVRLNKLEAVQILLAAGADPVAENNEKKTPFDYALGVEDAETRAQILLTLSGGGETQDMAEPPEPDAAAGRDIEAVKPVSFKAKPKNGPKPGGFKL